MNYNKYFDIILGGQGNELMHGEGGSNAFLLNEGIFSAKMGKNFDSGKIKIIICQQEFCPFNSTCLFEKPNFNEPYKMYCLCAEHGTKILLNGTCENYSNFINIYFKNYICFFF